MDVVRGVGRLMRCGGRGKKKFHFTVGRFFLHFEPSSCEFYSGVVPFGFGTFRVYFGY